MNGKQRCSGLFVAPLAAMLIATSSHAISLTRGPYVQMGHFTNQSTIVWRTDVSADSWVDYGLTASYGSIAGAGSGVQHEVILTGLLPGTNYYYRVRSAGVNLSSAQFKSGKAPGTPFRIATFSDAHDGGAGSVGSRMSLFNPDLILTAGDITDDSNAFATLDNNVFSKFTDVLKRVPLYWSSGNHDTLNNYAVCREAFVLPGDELSYWFEYADAQIVSLNAEGLPGTAWLANALASSSKPWKIVFFHEPAYSPPDGHGENATIRDQYVPIMEQYGVQLTVSGHNHFYWRSLPINGVTHFQQSRSGSRTRDITSMPCYSAAGINGSLMKSFGVVDIDGPFMRVAGYDDGGNLLDETVIDRECPFELDGVLDASAVQVANRSGGMSIWAAIAGRYLYVATQDAGNSGGGNDNFILLAQNLTGTTTNLWSWTKPGSTMAYNAFLADENDNDISGWFKADGTAVGNLRVARSATRWCSGNYLEGVIDLQYLYGGVPSTLYLAAAPYATANGGALVASQQCPAGNGDGNIDSNEFVAVSTAAIALQAPAAPTNVVATAVNSARIDITWSAAEHATSYVIRRGGNQIGTSTSTSYSDMGLTATTLYCYTVTATNLSGASAESSPAACATTMALPPLPPVPTSLTATPVSTERIDLSWSASSNATAYIVRRGGSQIATTASTTYSDTGLGAGTMYCYTVAATNAAGSSAESSSVCATTLSGPPFLLDGNVDSDGYLLAQSNGMNVWAAVYGNTLYVATWSAGSYSGDTSKPDKFIFVTDATGPLTNTVWGKSGQIAMDIRTKPYLGNESQNSWCGWQVNGVTTGGAGCSAAPTSAGVLEGMLNLVDAFGSAPATVYLAVAPYGTADAGALVASSQVPAGNGDGNIDAAEFLAVSVGSIRDDNLDGAWDPPPTPPAVPTNVVATAINSDRIDVSWSVSSNATAYIVRRDGSQVGTTASTNYSDTGLTVSTLYCYTVTATNPAGASAESSPAACATTPAAPPPTDTWILVPPAGATGSNILSSAGSFNWSLGHVPGDGEWGLITNNLPLDTTNLLYRSSGDYVIGSGGGLIISNSSGVAGGVNKLLQTGISFTFDNLLIGSNAIVEIGGSLTVNNTMTLSAGGRLALNGGTFIKGGTNLLNNGLISMRNGTLKGSAPINRGTITGYGTISTTAGIENTGGTLVVKDGSMNVTNLTSGLAITNGTVFVNNGTLIPKGDWGFGGALILDSGSVCGSTSIGAGGSRAFHLLSGGQIIANSGTSYIETTNAANFGGMTIDSGGTLQVNSGATFVFGRSTTAWNGGAPYGTNSGAIFMNGGTFTTYEMGTNNTSRGVVNSSTGVIKGIGTIKCNLISAGSLSPGSSAGSLTVNGNLTLRPNSAVRFELGGYTQGTQHDLIMVSKAATLDGMLTVQFINGFGGSVTNGASFTVLIANSLSGAFTNVANGGTIQTLDGSGTFTVSYSGSSLVLSGLVLANGDADGDGMLDSWELAFFGNTSQSATNDFDGDGQSNLAEYLAGTDPTNNVSSFRITGIEVEDSDIRVTWTMGSGKTNALQRTTGDASGSYRTNNFADIFTVTNTVGTVTNFLDSGAATNRPSLYYRIRLVP